MQSNSVNLADHADGMQLIRTLQCCIGKIGKNIGGCTRLLVTARRRHYTSDRGSVEDAQYMRLHNTGSSWGFAKNVSR